MVFPCRSSLDAVMSATQRLELRHGQSLAMTPPLLQSIKRLPLSHAELAAYVEAELERNPLLQEAEGGAYPASPARKATGPRPGGGGLRPPPLPATVGQGSGAASRPAGGEAELRPEFEATLAYAATL